VYRSESSKWNARITVAGKKISLGAHADERAAARAYDGTYVFLGGNDSSFNFKCPEQKKLGIRFSDKLGCNLSRHHLHIAQYE
jgi:hypothetical protein